jgi:hypothetical protein
VQKREYFRYLSKKQSQHVVNKVVVYVNGQWMIGMIGGQDEQDGFLALDNG